MNRKLVGAAAVAAVAALALTACSSSGSGKQENADAKQQITLFTTGDVNIQSLWKDSLIPAFEKAHSNITVKLTSADPSTDTSSLSKLAASVKSKRDPVMDVIDAGFLPNAESAGLLLPITEKDVPNLASVDPSSIPSAGQVPYRGSAVVLAYNSKAVSTPPATLDDVLAWVPQHPGRFTYNSPSTGGSGQGFVQAVLDSGLTADQSKAFVNGNDKDAQAKWTPGFEKLKALTPNVYQKTYPNGNQEVLNLLSSGAIDMTLTWSDMFLSAKEKGTLTDNIKAISLAAPGLPGGASVLGIPKNSTHAKAALEFINWVLEPAQQVTIASAVAGFPAIKVSELPADAQDRFKGLQTDGLQPFYSSDAVADMNAQWQKMVP